MRKVIVNSTPIIGLANIGKLDLLRLVYQKITIPQAVFDELISPSVRQQVLKNRDWIQVEHIQDASQKQMYRAKLHAGEVEVMILAQEKKADLVLLDDNAAKKTAKARQFIDRLDSRVTWMLDMLEQLDIPQLSEE